MPYQDQLNHLTHHRCRVPQCTEQVPNHFLLCKDHNRLIPDATRQKMLNARRCALRDGATEGQIRYYAKTVQEAIDLVAARIGVIPVGTGCQPAASGNLPGALIATNPTLKL